MKFLRRMPFPTAIAAFSILTAAPLAMASGGACPCFSRKDVVLALPDDDLSAWACEAATARSDYGSIKVQAWLRNGPIDDPSTQWFWNNNLRYNAYGTPPGARGRCGTSSPETITGDVPRFEVDPGNPENGWPQSDGELRACHNFIASVCKD